MLPTKVCRRQCHTCPCGRSSSLDQIKEHSGDPDTVVALQLAKERGDDHTRRTCFLTAPCRDHSGFGRRSEESPLHALFKYFHIGVSSFRVDVVRSVGVHT